jgi:hypothetical protein
VAGDLQMLPWAAQLKAARFGQNSKDHPDAHCLPLHPIQLHLHPQPRKIIQTRDLVMILYEANDGRREIFLMAAASARGRSTVVVRVFHRTLGR